MKEPIIAILLIAMLSMHSAISIQKASKLVKLNKKKINNSIAFASKIQAFKVEKKVRTKEVILILQMLVLTFQVLTGLINLYTSKVNSDTKKIMESMLSELVQFNENNNESKRLNCLNIKVSNQIYFEFFDYLRITSMIRRNVLHTDFSSSKCNSDSFASKECDILYTRIVGYEEREHALAFNKYNLMEVEDRLCDTSQDIIGEVAVFRARTTAIMNALNPKQSKASKNIDRFMKITDFFFDFLGVVEECTWVAQAQFDGVATQMDDFSKKQSAGLSDKDLSKAVPPNEADLVKSTMNSNNMFDQNQNIFGATWGTGGYVEKDLNGGNNSNVSLNNIRHIIVASPFKDMNGFFGAYRAMRGQLTIIRNKGGTNSKKQIAVAWIEVFMYFYPLIFYITHIAKIGLISGSRFMNLAYSVFLVNNCLLSLLTFVVKTLVVSDLFDQRDVLEKKIKDRKSDANTGNQISNIDKDIKKAKSARKWAMGGAVFYAIMMFMPFIIFFVIKKIVKHELESGGQFTSAAAHAILDTMLTIFIALKLARAIIMFIVAIVKMVIALKTRAQVKEEAPLNKKMLDAYSVTLMLQNKYILVKYNLFLLQAIQSHMAGIEQEIYYEENKEFFAKASIDIYGDISEGTGKKTSIITGLTMKEKDLSIIHFGSPPSDCKEKVNSLIRSSTTIGTRSSNSLHAVDIDTAATVEILNSFENVEDKVVCSNGAVGKVAPFRAFKTLRRKEKVFETLSNKDVLLRIGSENTSFFNKYWNSLKNYLTSDTERSEIWKRIIYTEILGPISSVMVFEKDPTNPKLTEYLNQLYSSFAIRVGSMKTLDNKRFIIYQRSFFSIRYLTSVVNSNGMPYPLSVDSSQSIFEIKENLSESNTKRVDYAISKLNLDLKGEILSQNVIFFIYTNNTEFRELWNVNVFNPLISEHPKSGKTDKTVEAIHSVFMFDPDNVVAPMKKDAKNRIFGLNLNLRSMEWNTDISKGQPNVNTQNIGLMNYSQFNKINFGNSGRILSEKHALVTEFLSFPCKDGSENETKVMKIFPDQASNPDVIFSTRFTLDIEEMECHNTRFPFEYIPMIKEDYIDALTKNPPTRITVFDSNTTVDEFNITRMKKELKQVMNFSKEVELKICAFMTDIEKMEADSSSPAHKCFPIPYTFARFYFVQQYNKTYYDAHRKNFMEIFGLNVINESKYFENIPNTNSKREDYEAQLRMGLSTIQETQEEVFEKLVELCESKKWTFNPNERTTKDKTLGLFLAHAFKPYNKKNVIVSTDSKLSKLGTLKGKAIFGLSKSNKCFYEAILNNYSRILLPLRKDKFDNMLVFKLYDSTTIEIKNKKSGEPNIKEDLFLYELKEEPLRSLKDNLIDLNSYDAEGSQGGIESLNNLSESKENVEEDSEYGFIFDSPEDGEDEQVEGEDISKTSKTIQQIEDSKKIAIESEQEKGEFDEDTSKVVSKNSKFRRLDGMHETDINRFNYSHDYSPSVYGNELEYAPLYKFYFIEIWSYKQEKCQSGEQYMNIVQSEYFDSKTGEKIKKNPFEELLDRGVLPIWPKTLQEDSSLNFKVESEEVKVVPDLKPSHDLFFTFNYDSTYHISYRVWGQFDFTMTYMKKSFENDMESNCVAFKKVEMVEKQKKRSIIKEKLNPHIQI